MDFFFKVRSHQDKAEDMGRMSSKTELIPKLPS